MSHSDANKEKTLEHDKKVHTHFHFLIRMKKRFSKHKIQKFYPHLLFTLTLLLVAYWQMVAMTIRSVISLRPTPVIPIELAVFDGVNTKTGLNFSLSNSLLVASDKLYAAMGGIPGWPKLIMSQRLLHEFSAQELEYVLLHEAGHAVRGHQLREVLATFAACAFVLPFFSKKHVWMKTRRQQQTLALTAGVIAGLLLIQVQRMHEYEADMYALMKGTRPQAMISATQKFAANWTGPGDSSPVRILLYRGIPYSQRISMAQRYIFDEQLPLQLAPNPEPLDLEP